MSDDNPEDVLPAPVPPKSSVPDDFPDLKDFGGIRSTKQAIRRSATIMANRECIAYEILAMASTKITDVMEWDEAGNVTLIPSAKLSHVHARMIKSVEQKFDKHGRVTSTKLELFDKVALLRLSAQAAGMLRNDQDGDKPAVTGVVMRGPKKRKPVTVDNG